VWLRDAVVRPFRTHHRVASQGYVLSSVKRKLKAHLAGRPGSDITALRAAGEVRHMSIKPSSFPGLRAVIRQAQAQGAPSGAPWRRNQGAVCCGAGA